LAVSLGSQPREDRRVFAEVALEAGEEVDAVRLHFAHVHESSFDAADLPTPGREFRRPGVSREQTEYAARFGKYYRLAEELSSKSD